MNYTGTVVGDISGKMVKRYMSKIRKISYFKKNAKKVQEKLNFGSQMLALRSELKYTKKLGSQGFYITYWKKEPFAFSHKFFVDPSTDRFIDLTCNKNCIYSYILAMDMEWINITQNSIPLTKWIEINPYAKIRLEVKEREFVMRYKDKYKNIVMNSDTVKIMFEVRKILMQITRQNNLEHSGYDVIKSLAEELMKSKIDRRLRDGFFDM